MRNVKMTHFYIAQKIKEQKRNVGIQSYEFYGKYKTSCCNWKDFI